MVFSWLTNDPEPELPYRMRLPPALWLIPFIIVIGLLLVLFVITRDEMRTSKLQAEWFSYYGARINYKVEAGPNPRLLFPESGPYNQRLGYAYIPYFTQMLATNGYGIAAQARTSPMYDYFIERGLYPIYHPKGTAGLMMYDEMGQPLYSASFPNHVFTDFQTIPPLLVDTLLFIENRELLHDKSPEHNPVIEWKRFGYAAVAHLMKVQGVNSGGGSTLATQIEKFRFSPGGQTMNGLDKIRQILSASLRVYLDGPNTRKAQEGIVLDYLNSTPLLARAGFGEVNGIGDGLWTWFGIDLDNAITAMKLPETDPDSLQAKAAVYRAALSLILAQRRPSYYLISNRDALDDLANAALDRLADAHVISSDLRMTTKKVHLKYLTDVPPAQQPPLVEMKAVNALRTHLMTMLGLRTLYEVDRLDAAAQTTINNDAQQKVTDFLQHMDDHDFLAKHGFYDFRLLTEDNDPANINWSVVIYERTNEGNKIRVQADNIDEAFDMNEGMKLDLGSTAKLRTLVTYLEILGELYQRYAGMAPDDLDNLADDSPDALTSWVIGYLHDHPKATKDEMLHASLDRHYSGNPHESFFTGGGLHNFANFEHSEDKDSMDLHEAFRNSVNLVFVRVMRDIVNYTIAQGPRTKEDVLDDPEAPERHQYLERFADQEGSSFLNRYIAAYDKMTPDEALERLVSHAHQGATARTLLFRSTRPNAGWNDYLAFMAKHPVREQLSNQRLAELFTNYPITRYNLSDRGYIVGVNPLELWLVAYMQANPKASHRVILEASRPIRLESYAWLFNPHLKHAQDTRIRIMIEQDAFASIYQRWARLGYPFSRLVPSLATAIGSSADRPGALAELVGIILNDGVKQPTVRFEGIAFGKDTPFQTVYLRDGHDKDQAVLDPAVTKAARDIMAEVADGGTAKRIKGVYVDKDGKPIAIGGKTGTGDQRYDEFGSGGRLISSRAVNRTGTFVFYLGDHFFGAITAHVAGEAADDYHYSSALAVQMLKELSPILIPLINGPPTVVSAPAPDASPTPGPIISDVIAP